MTPTRTRTSGRRLAVLALTGSLALVAAACSGDDDDVADDHRHGARHCGHGPGGHGGPGHHGGPGDHRGPRDHRADPDHGGRGARMPLTGVPLAPGEEAPARPAMVVKIDNAPDARPQTGFTAADIVYEEIVNDSLTRFAMVFHSQDSDPVGPIRSGRIQDIDLFGSLPRARCSCGAAATRR